ncbi:hypothetical protein ACQPVP_01570 [Clostridium nigeriense]|uniref:hypothetical protein n=1 Tax=Clostridium nigeriense TaxID=1805470 RepID=UPI003D34829B
MKNLTLKLLLVLLLSLSLISCGQKDNISKSNNENQDTTTPELFSVAGESNKVPGICEYYLNDINVATRIKPSIITENSSYYDVENNDNIYIDVILDVYNLSNEAKMADDIITTKIKIKNNKYSCFSLVESTDGSDLEKYTLINSLETRNIHYVAEVPIADSTTGELEIILTIDGKDYSNKFSLDSLQGSAKENTQQNTHPNEKQTLTEEEYYMIIKEAKQRQQDYIDSIDDHKVKQSVQTPYSAAIAESTALYIKYPDDTDTIDAALKKVLAGE